MSEQFVNWKGLALGLGSHLEHLEAHCAVKTGKRGDVHTSEGHLLRQTGRELIAQVKEALESDPVGISVRTSMRSALERIAATKYGFQSVGELHPDPDSTEYLIAIADYWRELAQEYQNTARIALRSEGDPNV